MLLHAFWLVIAFQQPAAPGWFTHQRVPELSLLGLRGHEGRCFLGEFSILSLNQMHQLLLIEG